jgi:hypothetical protein
MAIVVIEEVLMGLEDTKSSLEQAMTTLEWLVEDLRPEMGNHLRAALEKRLLYPLQSQVALLDTLLEEVATLAEESDGLV